MARGHQEVPEWEDLGLHGAGSRHQNLERKSAWGMMLFIHFCFEKEPLLKTKSPQDLIPMSSPILTTKCGSQGLVVSKRQMHPKRPNELSPGRRVRKKSVILEGKSWRR